MWRAFLGATVLAIALVTGCGGDDDDTTTTPTLDPADYEQQLIDDLAQFAGVDPSTVGLDCPSGVPAEEGHKFNCTLTAPDGSTADVRVTVTRAVVEGDQLDYEVEGVVPRGQFK
jgi:Domain of unknown function (DUF4333)